MRAIWLLSAAVVMWVSPFVFAQEGDKPAEAAEAEFDPLAELAALGDAVAEEGPEGGGSIRAKREVDKTLMARLKDKRNIEAKVEKVKLGKFPIVAVKLKITRPAKEGAGKAIKRNSSIVVVPNLKVDGGKVLLKDKDTLLNAGAFYLKRGDKVAVRLGEQKGKVWMADYIERK